MRQNLILFGSKIHIYFIRVHLTINLLFQHIIPKYIRRFIVNKVVQLIFRNSL